MSDVNLLETTDAAVWAKEFVRLHGGDEDLMIGWFANMWAATHDPLAAQVESLTSENTRLRDLLYEEVMDSYYALTSHKQARYAGPREYADYVFSYEGIAPLPSHKGED